MDKRNVRNSIADQITAKVRCLTCAKTAKDDFDKDSVSAAADAITKILKLCIENRMKWPAQAAVMSRSGQERLQRLVRLADFLEKRISETSPDKEVGYQSGELSALRWAIEMIRDIGIIEEESVTTPPSSQEKLPTYVASEKRSRIRTQFI
jgi:hypothetical protein